MARFDPLDGGDSNQRDPLASGQDYTGSGGPSYRDNLEQPVATAGGSGDTGGNSGVPDVFKTGGTATPYDAISQFYNTMLGRAPENQDVLTNWWEGSGHNLGTIQQGIFNTPEAAAYRQRTAAPPPSPVNSDWIGQTLSEVQSTDDPNYWRQVIASDPKVAAGDQSAIEYWKDRIRRGDGSALVRNGSLQKFQDNPSANWTSGQTQGNQFNGTSVFNDPATQQYEQLLNQLIGKFNQPFVPQSFQPSMDYLNQYFKQLQGPAYTPEQMDLMQTQLFDPIMQQRDASRKAIIDRFARQGMGPGSGPVQQALLQNDQAYERLGTQARAGVANNAIGVQKNQQAQAAQLGPLMASLESQLHSGNESRMLQGANLAGIVPQMAWSRLTGANSGIQPLNPGQFFDPYRQLQQQGYNQGSNFMNQLMGALFSIFGG